MSRSQPQKFKLSFNVCQSFVLCATDLFAIKLLGNFTRHSGMNDEPQSQVWLQKDQ